MSYLIYHPQRQKSVLGSITVYHDKFGGNEDPYLWNDHFLHTYCHITQMKNEIGQINFWVSGDQYPNFTKLFCDCVFVIEQKVFWKEKNSIRRSDSIVDNLQTFEHHYKWVNPPHNHHHFNKRERYTLKADAQKSFQPQTVDHQLIDIIPFLLKNKIELDHLHNEMQTNVGSRPYKFDDSIGAKLYTYLFDKADRKIFGNDIAHLHPHRLIETISKPTKCC